MMMFEHKLLRKSNLDLYSYLKKIFIDLGINKGDIVYVASDILKLIILCKHKKIKFDQGIIVNCLQDIIGNNGTLLFLILSLPAKSTICNCDVIKLSVPILFCVIVTIKIVCARDER